MNTTPIQPRDIAPICEAIAAPVIAERGPAPLQARGGRARLLKTESGRVVTHGEVMGALLARAKIEVAVVDGKRPEWIACEVCKVPVNVRERGAPPARCKVCSGKACMLCGKARCGARRPGYCAACFRETGEQARSAAQSLNKVRASLTPEQRSEASRKSAASQTPEQRSEIARARRLAEPQSRRLAQATHLNTAQTHEQRSEARRKAWAAMTPDQRSEHGRKVNSSQTHEQRSEAARKANATRRARKVAEAAKP